MNTLNVSDSDFADMWEQIWSYDSYQHPYYQSASINYVREYYSRSRFIDESFIIIENNVPVIGIMAVIKIENDQAELSSYGRPLLYLENNNTSYSLKKRATKIMKQELDRLFSEFDVQVINYLDNLHNNHLSVLGDYLLNRNATALPYYTQIIDLSLNEGELKKRVRKSYKSLINWGVSNMEISILDKHSIKLSDVYAFRELHILDAGRDMRSKYSWELQYKMVCEGEAFIVQGKINDHLVSSALFLHSNTTCYYSVSASKREQFSQPIFHALIMKSVLYAKSLNCKYYEIGEQIYSNQVSVSPSNKELGISLFKSGFGGETIVKLKIN